MAARPRSVEGAATCLALLAMLACNPRDRATGEASPARTVSSAAATPSVAPVVSLLEARLDNPAAYVPPQCYTQTRDADGTVHNPCFTCHTRAERPNFVDDEALQIHYDFRAPARENRWMNLYVDRRADVAAVTDEEILRHVRTSNYRAGERLLLAETLHPRQGGKLPEAWDVDHDGRWGGYVPDAHFDFDERGFDRDPKGAPTGWRAYAYYPFPGVFFPTNGSAGDVLFRLPAAFREGEDGRYDPTVYRVNLALTEALIKRRDVAIEAVDEEALGVDLDQDGKRGRATRVAFRPEAMRYVGRARLEQAAGKIALEPGLFPGGTELLHSVRYLDVVNGEVTMAARFKELRYARKAAWVSSDKLAELAAAEARELRDYPDRLERMLGEPEHGLSNGQGWLYQGFIEDRDGALRPQTLEETTFCMGCHRGVGATTDGVFSFRRKLDASAQAEGWFHWTQHGLRGLAEPQAADGRYEYTFYLEQNGAGDDLRDNEEVIAKFFHGQALRPDVVARLHGDIAELLLPSPQRALMLDATYRSIVLAQSFTRGRDATLTPAARVHRRVEPHQATGIITPVAAPLAPRPAFTP